ncbi:S9 family peptidase [Fodinicola acaciae]|uniref:S9 family peptidase n=1 Tax=Fodinicola acaciae TaxID=2681555 RepID=UPI0013D8664D|nr:S9 family peptidase [Fodinicola acaciae]
MDEDLRAYVSNFQHQLHKPAFGAPHALREPHVSRDGRRVVVTASVYDALDGLPRTAIYTVADGRLHAMPSLGGSTRGARYAPDGRTLAALTDSAAAGVFQLQLNTGDELVAAPHVPGTVEYLRWSADGTRILLGVAAPGADLAGGQGSGTHVRDTAEQPEWMPTVEDGSASDGWRTLWVYDVGTGELARISAPGLNCWEADWCGSDRVVAITSPAPDEDSWYGAEVTLLDLGGGASKRLYASPVQLGWVTGSLDGRRVAVVRAICSDRWLVAGDLVLIDVATGATAVADTAGTDVTWLQWIDERRLGYLGRRHLDSVAAVLDTEDGRTDEIFAVGRAAGGWHPEGAFTQDGRVVTVQHGYRTPHQVMLDEVVIASVAHAGTDWLLSVAGRSEPVSWRAPDGLEIEGILCTPAGDGPFPLVVTIHGGPIWSFCDQWSMNYAWVPLLVARGYAVLNPNPRGSSGRGQEFAGHVVRDMGGADAHDILSGIDELVRRGVADPDRIGLIGRSYGGFMSAWLVTQSTRFAAAVPLSPVTDWYSQAFTSNVAGWGNSFLGADPEEPGNAVHQRSPVLRASRVRTPCLNVAGALDRCTPPTQALEFHRALRAYGVDSTLVIYPQEGHGVAGYPALVDFLARVLGWFERYMPAWY